MPLLDLLWVVLWSSVFIIWIWALVDVYADIFRSHDLGGWGKALWALFVLLLPFLGIVVYLAVRGGSMTRRASGVATGTQHANEAYLRDMAATRTSEELSKLAQLFDRGVLTREELEQQRMRLLGADTTTRVGES